MKLLSLVLLLSVFSSLTLTEVVEDVNEWKSFVKCGSFFIPKPKNQNDVITPTVFEGGQYKTICQRWKNVYTFATVYDTVRRIPVYSAYTFSKKKPKRNDVWKIEPQLDNITKDTKGKKIDNKQMMNSNKADATAMNIIHQAVNSDYTNPTYERGHVFPRSFAANQYQADSTFTLTNIAPQTKDNNWKWENQVETPMRSLITDKCNPDQNQVYIVSGVVPGNNWTSITRGDQEITEGINVPSHFWSAFCCASKTDMNNLIGKAYIAEQENFSLNITTITDLNEQLTDLYKKNFSVFPGLKVNDINHPF